MKRWDYLFGVSLPESIKDKLECNLLRNNPAYFGLPGFEKEAFTPDGYPVNAKPDTIYPALLHRTIGIPVSDSLTEIEPEFRRTASVAALKWLEKVLLCTTQHWSFDGLNIQHTIDGEVINFCFPTTTVMQTIDNTHAEYCAVLPFPDTFLNDEDWECGMIPQYAEQQAQLLLWCHQQYADLHPGTAAAKKAFLVRIKGNIAADCTVRSVTYDPKKAMQILKKVHRAVIASKANGTGLTDNLVLIPKRDWKEEKQRDLDDAYCVDDPAYYGLLGKYMEARSTRKRLEEEAKAVKEHMHTLAITLASQTSISGKRGEITDGDTIYSVSHTPKRVTRPTISADLLRQLAPEHVDAIIVSSTPRGRITIDVL